MRFSSLFALRRWLPGALALLAGCTDSFAPDVTTSPPSLLVVDGFLNSQGVTTIKLSRAYAIASKTAAPTETRATVYIEDEAGTRLLLTETSVKGTYTSAAQTLNPARKYRLHLNTLAGKEYASDYVPVKTTPAIDAVTWRTDNEGLNIYVNTHDATGNSQYYRWDYVETWEINPIYRPQVEYVNGAMRDIVVPFPTICWGTAPSTPIQIAKTTALTQDVVSDFRVRQLPTTSNLLDSRYSILVQQHALTKEEYGYWELLRKNTESIGSLFDAQPAQLTGNVRCLNSPSDAALGFIGAHSMTEKRIFIRRAELPRAWLVKNGYESCQPPDSVFFDRGMPPPNPAQVLQSIFGAGSALPIEELYNKMGVLNGYTAKSRDCIDCRTRGTSVKPSFWP
ncbi:DUF4249 domain-containing protein [Hymenobacter sp. M29]|uniref:DUF4249 domain-containing protein n=1 Tax=Hymenobacter mellowenesis TaxID=3063995 RepID=A0ABT9ADS2_9BACT|nr:DUF4249 domain-containing protein [Hymenobacter sp. M29]MDO7847975.1 DUF4249 domain-containing protein [Hymenobacter sp. M29]